MESPSIIETARDKIETVSQKLRPIVERIIPEKKSPLSFFDTLPHLNPPMAEFIKTAKDQGLSLLPLTQLILILGGEDFSPIDPNRPLIEKNGQKVFNYLPQNHPNYQRFVKVRNQLAEHLAQQQDFVKLEKLIIKERPEPTGENNDQKIQKILKFCLDHPDQIAAWQKQGILPKNFDLSYIPNITWRSIREQKSLPHSLVNFLYPFDQTVFRLTEGEVAVSNLTDYINYLDQQMAIAREIAINPQNETLGHQLAEIVGQRLTLTIHQSIRTILTAEMTGYCQLSPTEKRELIKILETNDLSGLFGWDKKTKTYFVEKFGRKFWKEKMRERKKGNKALLIIRKKINELVQSSSPFAIDVPRDNDNERKNKLVKDINDKYQEAEKIRSRRRFFSKIWKLTPAVALPIAAASTEAGGQAELVIAKKFFTGLGQALIDLSHGKRPHLLDSFSPGGIFSFLGNKAGELIEEGKATAFETGNRLLFTYRERLTQKPKIQSLNLIHRQPTPLSQVQESDHQPFPETSLLPKTLEECLKPEFRETLADSLYQLYYQGYYQFTDEGEFFLESEVRQRTQELAQTIQSQISSSVDQARLSQPIDQINGLPKKGSLISQEQVAQELVNFYLKLTPEAEKPPIERVYPKEGVEDYPLAKARKRLAYRGAEVVVGQIKRWATQEEAKPHDFKRFSTVEEFENFIATNKGELFYFPPQLSIIKSWIEKNGDQFRSQAALLEFLSTALYLHQQNLININLISFLDPTIFFQRLKQKSSTDFIAPLTALGFVFGTIVDTKQRFVNSKSTDLFPQRTTPISRKQFFRGVIGTAVSLSLGATFAQTAKFFADPRQIIDAGLNQLNHQLWEEVEKRASKVLVYPPPMVGSLLVKDERGQIIGEYYPQGKREMLSFSEIPNFFIKVLTSTEDFEFFNHPGVNSRGLLRTVFYNGDRGGGSGITQQLVKLLAYSPEELAQELKNPSLRFQRKAVDMVLALTLEKKLEEFFRSQNFNEKDARRKTKETILEIYLNLAPFGPNIYGLRTASRVYFNKEPHELSDAEMIFLAGLPQSPSYYWPERQFKQKIDGVKEPTAILQSDGRVMILTGHPAYQRYLSVVEILKNHGVISEEKSFQLRETPIFLYPSTQPQNREPYLLALTTLTQNQSLTDLTAGMEITTTIDQKLQEELKTKAEDFFKKKARENEADYLGVVVTEAKTGKIKGIISIRAQKDNQGNIVSIIPSIEEINSCWVGSVVKPLTYAAGLEEAAITDQNPNLTGNQFHGVQNFGNKNYGNSVAWPFALASSLNGAAQQLAERVGSLKLISIWERFGLIKRNRLDLSQISANLTLGTVPVSLLDLNEAYGVLANDGLRQTPQIIREIVEPATNKSLYQSQSKNQPILDPTVAQQIVSVLSDDRNRPEFINLNGGKRRYWVKTGTDSNPKGNPRGLTVVGGTNTQNPYIVSVYLGSNKPEGLTGQGIVSDSLVGSFWREIVEGIVLKQ